MFAHLKPCISMVRDRLDTRALRFSFTKKLEENDFHCPYCKKYLKDVKKVNETYLRHADQLCTEEGKKRKREEEEQDAFENERMESFDPVLQADIQEPNHSGLREEANYGNEGSESEEEERDDPEEGPWEGWLLDASKEVHVNGDKRQTAAQLRSYLKHTIGSISVGDIARQMIEAQMPEKTADGMLSLIRQVLPATKQKYVPQSMHNIKRALKARHIDSTAIHICSTCWNYAWKPCLKSEWPIHVEQCICKACTCPACGKGKRFDCKSPQKVEPKAVRSSETWI